MTGSLVPETALYKWNDALVPSLSNLGVDIRRDLFQHDARMKSAGFESVEFRDLKSSFGSWTNSQRGEVGDFGQAWFAEFGAAVGEESQGADGGGVG